MGNGEGDIEHRGLAGGFAFFGSDEGFFELFDDWDGPSGLDCFDGFEGRNPKRRPGRKKLQLRSALLYRTCSYAHLCACVCVGNSATANVYSKGTERPCGNGNGQ